MVDTPAIWKPQHQVNLTDTDDQDMPAVISIGGGRYLVAWKEDDGGTVVPGNGDDIVGQIFDALGNPIGAEFQLNQSFIANNQLDVAVAGRLGGGFVVVYVDDDGGATDKIRIEHYDIDGNKIAGPPSTVAEDAAANMDVPQIAMAADGSHLVVYERDNGGGNIDILGTIVNPDGSLGTAEFVIDGTGDPEEIITPAVAALSNGNFVVAYSDDQPGANTNNAACFRIITPGTPPTVGGQVILNNIPANNQFEPKVAALTGGGFVLVYTETVAGNDDIRAAVVDNNGVVVKATFTVNNVTTGSQNEPVVAALSDGGFVIVWDDDNAGNLTGQRFDAAGNEVGAEFVAGVIGEETNPTITALDDGRFFVGFEQSTGDDDAIGTIFDPREKTITGSGDDDILTAFANGGTVLGKAGDDMLLGSDKGDNLKGGGGKDYLVGMDGNDDLAGGAAQDFYVFAFELDKNNNVDTVNGFRSKQKDKLLLLDDIFPAVGDKVNKGELRFGLNAQDNNDYIIARVQANKKKVTLSYDEDGQGGVGKVKFAVLEYKGDLKLNYKTFKVIDDLDI